MVIVVVVTGVIVVVDVVVIVVVVVVVLVLTVVVVVVVISLQIYSIFKHLYSPEMRPGQGLPNSALKLSEVVHMHNAQ